MNIAPNFVAPTHHHVQIVNEHGVQAEYARNGFCPHHADIQLRKKKRFGGWKTVRDSCPKCDRLNTQGPTSPVTPMPQQSPSLPAFQIQTTSSSCKIAAILSKMQMNERNADIQIKCCSELCNLAANNDKNKVTIAAAGGITTILSAMKTHFSNANVQHYGCEGLMNLAVNDKNKVTIVEAGGITTILSAMKTRSSNATVQDNGCVALQNLALRNDKNKVTNLVAGGITTILFAMKTHSSNAYVQYYGCGALFYLALNDNNKVMIADAGGITTIPSAMMTHSSNDVVQHLMKTHSSNANVQQYGCGALGTLATHNESIKLIIADAGGEDAIKSAIRNHSSNAGVYEKGNEALRIFQPISTTSKRVHLPSLTTPTPSSSNSTDLISEGQSKMKEAMDNVNSRPIELSVEFITYCTNNFAEVRKLGQGAFGVVYKGQDDNWDFAVKCILFNIAVEKNKVEEVTKGFKRELQVSSFVVSNIAFRFKSLCFSFYFHTVSGIEEVPTPQYYNFVWLSFVLWFTLSIPCV